MKNKKITLDNEISRLEKFIHELDPKKEEYGICAKHLQTLYETQNRRDHVDKKTIALCATNLIGIAIVCFKEQIGIVTSKALSMVMKPKS